MSLLPARVPRWCAALLTALAALLLSPLALSSPAAAHDATSTAYAEVTGTGDDVRATLDLEYDLLMKSAWLYAEAYDAKGRAEQLRQLAANAEAVHDYVTDRFAVTLDGTPCTPRRGTGDADVRARGSRSYAVLTIGYDCPGTGDGGGTYTVSSALFPDAETFVHGTRTIVHYDLGGHRGSQVLTVAEPTLETGGHQEARQMAEFFVLGGEHLLFGLDHVLFLLSLLIAARRLRDVVLTVTAFTAAHSVTFLLAATGVVTVPGAVVEPVIAASIAVVAVAGVLPRNREDTGRRWLTVAVVFVFGLVHGLGFAGALGIDEGWSWELLLSLLSFNVGVEAAQLGVVAVVYPLLALVRRTPAHRWALPVLTAPVVAVSLYWFWDRVALAA
ncbi:HupE/UreJ family protein [Streptomyces sp. NPDC001595]|uniref:HupE/UreJ family protein n=1 Tax=Streptomyces sp. NPDC001532 TaxID=3154520 RepID=UPI00332E3FF7